MKVFACVALSTSTPRAARPDEEHDVDLRGIEDGVAHRLLHFIAGLGLLRKELVERLVAHGENLRLDSWNIGRR